MVFTAGFRYQLVSSLQDVRTNHYVEMLPKGAPVTANFKLETRLPHGLSLCSQTGKIRGEAKVPTKRQSYLIRATLTDDGFVALAEIYFDVVCGGPAKGVFHSRPVEISDDAQHPTGISSPNDQHKCGKGVPPYVTCVHSRENGAKITSTTSLGFLPAWSLSGDVNLTEHLPTSSKLNSVCRVSTMSSRRQVQGVTSQNSTGDVDLTEHQNSTGDVDLAEFLPMSSNLDSVCRLSTMSSRITGQRKPHPLLERKQTRFASETKVIEVDPQTISHVNSYKSQGTYCSVGKSILKAASIESLEDKENNLRRATAAGWPEDTSSTGSEASSVTDDAYDMSEDENGSSFNSNAGSSKDATLSATASTPPPPTCLGKVKYTLKRSPEIVDVADFSEDENGSSFNSSPGSSKDATLSTTASRPPPHTSLDKVRYTLKRSPETADVPDTVYTASPTPPSATSLDKVWFGRHRKLTSSTSNRNASATPPVSGASCTSSGRSRTAPHKTDAPATIVGPASFKTVPVKSVMGRWSTKSASENNDEVMSVMRSRSTKNASENDEGKPKTIVKKYSTHQTATARKSMVYRKSIKRTCTTGTIVPLPKKSESSSSEFGRFRYAVKDPVWYLQVGKYAELFPESPGWTHFQCEEGLVPGMKVDHVTGTISGSPEEETGVVHTVITATLASSQKLQKAQLFLMVQS